MPPDRLRPNPREPGCRQLPIAGFGSDARDYDIGIENRKIGAGLRMTGSRPMTRLALWSIRSVLSIEPFIDVSVAPGGAVMAWTYTYTYHAVEM